MEGVCATLGLVGLLFLTLFAWAARGARRRRLRLDAFAAGLEGGRVVAPPSDLVGLDELVVTGRRAGRDVRLWFARFEHMEGADHRIVHQVCVPGPPPGFELRASGLLDRLARRATGAGDDGLPPDLAPGHVLASGSAADVRVLLQDEAVRRSVHDLLALPGLVAVALRADQLLAERALREAWLAPAALDDAFARLDAVARRCEGRGGAAQAATGSGAP